MAFLDNIPPDPNPLIITLDFSKYVDGEKFSTLMRQLFTQVGQPTYGVNTYEEYVAQLLLKSMKEYYQKVYDMDKAQQNADFLMNLNATFDAKKADLDAIVLQKKPGV